MSSAEKAQSGVTYPCKRVRNTFYDTVQNLSGVVLLNSPTNSTWEFEEYLRLLVEASIRTQPTAEEGRAKDSIHCFLCADGAYGKLREYCAKHPDWIERCKKKLEAQGVECGTIRVERLCDAVVGDMDSTPRVASAPLEDAQAKEEEEGAKGTVPLAPAHRLKVHDGIPTWRFETIKAVSDELIEEIHSRSKSRLATPASAESEVSDSPVRFHILCQMTTDFEKCLLTIQRVLAKYPEEVAPLPVFPSSVKTATATSANEDAEAAKEQERELELEKNARERTTPMDLPTVLALGALGGRFDHEMGAISTVVEHDQNLNTVLSDEGNTIISCVRGGITQFYHSPKYETTKCGLLNFGPMQVCETSGLQYNIAIGRGQNHWSSQYRFDFGRIISACNTCVEGGVVTVDLTVDENSANAPHNHQQNSSANEEFWVNSTYQAPVVFSVERLAQ